MTTHLIKLEVVEFKIKGAKVGYFFGRVVGASSLMCELLAIWHEVTFHLPISPLFGTIFFPCLFTLFFVWGVWLRFALLNLKEN